MAVLGAVVVVALTIAGSSSSSVAGGRPAQSSALSADVGNGLTSVPCKDAANWDAAGPDPEHRRPLDVSCAVLQVPVDHAHPDRGTLPMAMVRVRSSRQHDRIGWLVLNPGGPGASGLDAMPWWAGGLPGELLERFDLVTFDPRGTGTSAPVACDLRSADARPLADVLSDTAFAAESARAAANGKACADVLAGVGGSYGTDAVARDLDLLRQALGDERLTYVGWSYGARRADPQRPAGPRPTGEVGPSS